MAKLKDNEIANGKTGMTNGATTGADLKTTTQLAATKKRPAGTQENGNGNVNEAKRARTESRTDYTRWRMRDQDSRHTWHYLEDDEAVKNWPQTDADKYYLGLPLVRSLRRNPIRPFPFGLNARLIYTCAAI